MPLNRARLGAIRLGGLLLAALPGWAVAVTCGVSATSTAFGVYSPNAGTSLDTTGTVTVTCQPDIAALLFPYSVRLSTGGSATYSPRRMFNGAASLQYQLYFDSARTQVWGDGTGATVFLSDSILLSVLAPVTRNYTVYGRIPSGQTGAAAGSYLDTITVTISY
ncbi:fimbrial major subunit CsuA/B family protein [Azoarcus sp. TTM-91]|uniref:Csu type fimbrial protein n=1 Tax=Azoarcus sp. TTM-91 TaxID=2691581 RepID=UPI00145CDE1B|nr:spore coat U domain-containing protein [Azoarcus sp. TTM-91]NMG35436.1 fimbrial major subunit CsuA/B family protein [Azoarcus sp. TTM-91]